MSDRNPGCPLCHAHGYVLSGIVARESSTGQFSGSTSSIGPSHDGLTLSAGTIRGETSHSSMLAQQLACPAPSAVEPRNPYSGMAVFTGLAMTLSYLIPNMMAIGSNVEPASEITLFGAIDSWVCWIMLVSSLIGFVWSTFCAIRHTTDEQEIAEYKHFVNIDRVVRVTHQRLRYCPADHLVFDPLSRRTCQPNAGDIKAMLFSIAQSK